jgi:hypothetical protein
MMNMSENKKRRKFGPWSQVDKDYIAENANKLSVDEISQYLNRDPETVSRYIRKTLGLRIQTKGKGNVLSSGTDIENSMIWEQLETQFTQDELRVFLYHWNRIVLQFREDVYPTEEMQIIDMIKLEIMAERSLRSQKETWEKIQDLQRVIAEEKEKTLDGGNFSRLDMLERQLGSQKTAYELTDKTFHELLNRKTSMLKELKGTRDQRLKRIEDSKQTFTGWITEVVSNPNMRRELGQYIEKMRLAVSAEEDRLKQPYKYADNDVDLPLLTPETITELHEKEENEIQEEV